MYRIRIATLGFIVALTFAPLPAHAQGAPRGPSSNLSKRVAALEARVATLEGNITDADLIGTYRVSGLVLDLDGPPAGIQIGAWVGGTMTLRSDNTGTVVAEGDGIDLAEGTPWTSGVFHHPEEQIEITWSFDNGSLHVSDGTVDFDIFLDVGVGGRVLTYSGLSDDNTIDLLIATRLQ